MAFWSVAVQCRTRSLYCHYLLWSFTPAPPASPPTPRPPPAAALHPRHYLHHHHLRPPPLSDKDKNCSTNFLPGHRLSSALQLACDTSVVGSFMLFARSSDSSLSSLPQSPSSTIVQIIGIIVILLIHPVAALAVREVPRLNFLHRRYLNCGSVRTGCGRVGRAAAMSGEVPQLLRVA